MAGSGLTLATPDIRPKFPQDYRDPSTVKTHVTRIFTKLGLRDRAQAVIYGYETDWLGHARRSVLDDGVGPLNGSDKPVISGTFLAASPDPDGPAPSGKDAEGGWYRAIAPAQLRQAVHDNLTNLGLDVLDVVNLRVGGGEDGHSPEPGSIAEPFTVLAELQQEGLIKHLGISTVSAGQVAEAQSIAPIVCVQNLYNLAHRADEDLIDSLAAQGIAYVPYFPLGGFSPLQSDTLESAPKRLDATPMAVALAWLLQRSPNILLIPGTSSVAHLRANVTSAGLTLSDDELAELNSIAPRA